MTFIGAMKINTGVKIGWNELHRGYEDQYQGGNRLE
ncbi:hypothetical protein J2Z37_002502 [Ammoniphilus resinae]|uniref:Transposase n=1 Tax=Ammoniphilus resinae TaxID=861532 RepID=A0ABS4GQF1_9BACL|nr:hypothetical protein [Ammoniphilus resinae]